MCRDTDTMTTVFPSPTMASRWTWVFLVVHFASLFLTAIGQCTYTTTTDTGVDQALWNTASTVANIGECQDACTADTACLSAEFLTAGGTCFRFHTATVPLSRANSIYTVKECSGETCSYSDQVGKKGPQNLWTGFKATADLDACKTFCGTQSKCIAGEFNSGSFSCYLYSSEPTLTADTQTTFFLRTCVTETTTAATTVITTTSHPTTVATSTTTATTTATTFVTSTTPTPTTLTTSTFPDTTTTSAPATSPTTTPTTNPKPCSMTKSSRTTDGAVDYKVSLGNADSCNSICLHTKTCRATTYTPGNCTLHSQTLTAASGDNVDFVRQTCNDGTFCCMSSATTQKTNGTPILSISTTASLEGCEAICLAVADCKGTYYSDESCFFYTTTPTTSDGPILFSKKTCPGDQTNHGQLAYDTTCEGPNNSASTGIIHGRITAFLIMHISLTLSSCSLFWPTDNMLNSFIQT
ncbi:integumentary mucin A.1-like isoform X7 [Haliotis cracherodii]|uniref:integumentary mucin A.1-like isoform X7 n=1 Tax=Haliotis cracherodii TaxID=6455 RepID=UPI0039E86189